MRELEQHLLTYPGLSWWVPSSSEYLIGGPWRHRDEIADELTVVRSDPVLGQQAGEHNDARPDQDAWSGDVAEEHQAEHHRPQKQCVVKWRQRRGRRCDLPVRHGSRA